MDAGRVAGALFINHIKPFDTVHLDGPLSKHFLFAFQDNALDWFENCMTDRTQVQLASIGNQLSIAGTVKFELPQSSVLGLILHFYFVYTAISPGGGGTRV